MLEPDHFRQKFKLDGGGRPQEEIIDFISYIYYDSEDNIKEIIKKYFQNFIHNRVGTLLLKSEKENINKSSRPIFNERTKGTLMPHLRRSEEYEWVIYMGPADISTSRKVKILTRDYRDTLKIIETVVFPGALFWYPPEEKIIPEINNNFKYDGNNIYETYNLDLE